MGDIKIGNSSITLKLGSADVSAAYLGSTLVYSGGTPPTSDNIIEYTAPSKLVETTSSSSAGIHTNAFSGTSGQLTITSHTFDNGVGTIAFNGDVKRVGTYAFFRCSGATSFTIPSSVSAFDNQPFWGCISLTDITIKAITAPTFNGLVFDNTNNCNINVPCDCIVEYASASMFFNYGWTSRLKGISPCTNKVRYTNSSTTCHDYDLYQVSALQLSTDNGSTWSYVSPAVTQEYLLERNSVDCGYVSNYFTIKSLVASNTVTISNNSTASTSFAYSTNSGETWTDFMLPTGQTYTITTLGEGETVMLKGSNTTLGYSYNRGHFFRGSGNYEVQGNIMSLLSNTDTDTEFSGGTNNFAQLFSGDTHLISAENLVVPASAMTQSAFNSAFRSCTNLTKAPELPATTLAKECYSSMFEGCISLSKPPSILTATAFQMNCYQRMFCMSRTSSVQSQMTYTPKMYGSYNSVSFASQMFCGNNSLNTVECYITRDSGDFNQQNWMNYTNSTGTFKKISTQNFASGVNGIPAGWTIENV